MNDRMRHLVTFAAAALALAVVGAWGFGPPTHSVRSNGVGDARRAPATIAAKSQRSGALQPLPSVDVEMLEPAPVRGEWHALFRTLELQGGDETLEGHIASTRAELVDAYGDAEGDRLAEVYAKFARYRYALEVVGADDGPGMPFDLEVALPQVARERAFAQDLLGDELSELLVEPDLSRREHQLRRREILEDPQLDAWEKREALQELGEAPEGALSMPRNRHDLWRETLALHARELEEAGEGRAALEDALRREVMGDEVVDRMEAIARKFAP